tara:strand:+ start:897 stop:1307 length:411 start_codon:yes stop_codon:yes gene_type:complete
MENQTLIIALGLVAMVTGIALLTNWASNKQIPGLLGIAAGYMATCVGVLLASMQGILPPVVSIFLANALIMGGRIPVLFCSVRSGKFLEPGEYQAAAVLHRLVCRQYCWLLLFYVCRRKYSLAHPHLYRDDGDFLC